MWLRHVTYRRMATGGQLFGHTRHRRPAPAIMLRSIGLLAALSLSPWLAAAQPSADSTPVVPRRTVVLPVLGAAPETGAQYGVALFVTRSSPAQSTRPSSMVGNAVRTAKAQTRVFFDVDRWTAGNQWRVLLNSSWQEFPLLYYGNGDSAPDSAEEAYTPRGTELALTVQRRIGPAVWLQAGARRVEQAIVRTEPGWSLAGDSIVGSSGGRTVLAVVGVVADSRDNLFAPARGHLVELTASSAHRAIGSEFDFQRVRLDARGYRTLGRAHVLAGQFLVQGTGGEAPFDQLALVGSSSTMRGYAAGRFRDRWLTTAQVEYRSPLVGRFGASAFGGAALLGSSIDDVAKSRLLTTYGAGLRFRLDKVARSTVRLDYALGAAGQSGLYLAFSEAF